MFAVGTAHADSRSKLFPLDSSGLPRPLEAAAGELTRVLARSLGAEPTTVPIEDAAELLECALTDKACLDAIAKSVGVSTIRFGKLVERRGDAVIELTTYDVGKGTSHRTIPIHGDSPEELGESLRDALEDKPAEPIPSAPRRDLDLTTPAPTSTHGQVTPATWGLVIGGGVTLGAGVGFLLSARSLSRQVQTAPTATRDDINHLVALETAGRARTQIGGALTAIGAAGLTIGVVRMIVQKRAARADEPRLDLVPEAGGGATVRFSMGWR